MMGRYSALHILRCDIEPSQDHPSCCLDAATSISVHTLNLRPEQPDVRRSPRTGPTELLISQLNVTQWGLVCMQRWQHTNRTSAAAVFAMAFLATAQAGGLNECSLKRATTVCHSAGQVLRIIHESRSPSGHYAIAWFASAPGATFETNPTDGTVSVTSGEARNSLIRLQDVAAVARDVGTHPGDLAAYNHRRSDVRWSADSALVVVLNHDKWETLSGKIFRVGRGGHAVGPFDLLAFGQEAGRRKLGQLSGTDPTDYAARVNVESVGNNGIVRARITMEQPGGGGEAYAFSMSLQVREVSAALQPKKIKIGRLRRIE